MWVEDIESAFVRAAPAEGDPTQTRALALVKAALLGGAAPPVTIGRYRVLSLVGRGAMGIVYAAWDPQLERRVALKVVAPSGRDPAGEQARLLREGQALAQLGHPNVVAVHDAGIHDGAVYLAMEYVEGPTLAQWLAQARRTRDEILRVVVAAGRGLAAAHRAGIVHRDFKPDNVLIGAPDRVRVVDFGLARSCGDRGDTIDASSSATTTSTRGGTPAYAAPEQLAGERVAAPADQYAFCVVLHEALTGRVPRSADDVDPALPRRLRRALERGLRRTADRRFADLDDLVAAIVQRDARRVLVAGVLLCGAAAAIAAASPAMHACDGDPGAMAEVWTGERRAAAAEMFATADPTRGPSAWRRSEAILADYAARWEIARAASCAAEVPSSDERELRLACLADRRDHVDALVQVLGEPDPAVVRHAVDAAHALPSIEACNRVDSLGRAPLERIATPQRAQVWRRIARASALRRAGRYADAAELATSLVDEAGTATHRAAALHLAAEVETDRQQYVRAQELAREAVHAAAEAGDARIEFGSWLLLLYGVGWGRGRADEALAYGEAARAALLRLGDDVQLHSELLGALAAVEHQRGRHLETIALAEQAIALRESDDEGAARSGPLWQILGIAQHRLDREEDALVSHDHALARITALLGPTHPDTAQTLASRAQVLKALGRIDEARAGYEDAIAALEGTFGAQHRALAIPLLNLGNLERAEGDPSRAALVHARYREIVAREFPPDHHEHGRAHVSLAEEQLAAGDADAALASAAAAVGIARRHFAEPHVRLSYALGIQGAALLQLGRAHDAVAAHEEALALARRVLAPDDHELAAYLLDLADALAAADRRGDARSLRQQAREHLRRIPTAASVVRPRARELLERADRVL